MVRFFKALTTTAIALFIIIGIVLYLKKMSSKESDAQEVKQKALKDIDLTFKELKENIEGKSALHIDKTLNRAVENAKKELDRLSEQIKTGYHKTNSEINT